MAFGKKTTLISAACLIAGLCFPLAQTAAADTSHLTVNSDKALQAALAAAAPGATIYVQPGVYQGPFRIDKRLHLLAAGKAVLDGGGQHDVVTLAADGIELRGFTIRNSGTDLNQDEAGIQVRSSHNRILGNRIEQCLHGIYLHEANDNEIVQNQIVGLQNFEQNDRGNGIHFFHSSGNDLQQNEISSTRDGMYFSYSDDNRVENCQVHDVRYGLHYMYSNDNTFDHNRFTHNIGGAALMFSKGIKLTHNVFADHLGQRGTAIVMNTCDDSLIEQNDIDNNTRAIFMDSSSRNQIDHNRVVDNFTGIELPSSSSDNRIYANDFVGIDVPVITDNEGTSNQWYDAGSKRGNYWSLAAAVDLNSDGVSDAAYQLVTVQSSLIGKYPDLRFLADSPLMKLLDFAYRQFPIFQIPSPQDPYPLVKPVGK